MKKKDLKTGMRVKYRDGQIRIIMLNTVKGDVLSTGRAVGNYLSVYSDDLIDQTPDPRHDIMVVYKGGAYNVDENELGCIYWKREEGTLFTLDGIEYSESTARSIIKKANDC